MTASICFTDNCFFVSGELNFLTVVNLWQDSLPLLNGKNDLTFDLSRVTAANSAALALLLEWQKFANVMRKTILFQNIPASISSIASVAGIDAILKI